MYSVVDNCFDFQDIGVTARAQLFKKRVWLLYLTTRVLLVD